MHLSEQSCVPCQHVTQALNDDEINTLLSEIPAWQCIHVDGIPQLQRRYRFTNFAEALVFTNRVGAMAEVVFHHPDLLTVWGAVTVTWWSHNIKGLHRNDFIMAARTDTAYEEGDGSQLAQ